MRLMRFTALIMSLFAVAALGCGEKIQPGTTGEQNAPAVKAPVAEAAVTDQPFLYEAVATITARTASTLSGKLMGTVQAVHVREGDMVKQGEALLTLDQRQVKAQLDKARAGLREARRAEASAVSARDAANAAAQLAASTYNRYQQLLKENSASQARSSKRSRPAIARPRPRSPRHKPCSKPPVRASSRLKPRCAKPPLPARMPP